MFYLYSDFKNYSRKVYVSASFYKSSSGFSPKTPTNKLEWVISTFVFVEKDVLIDIIFVKVAI